MKIDVTVPDGESGNWRVESFTITEDEAKFENMRSAFSFTNRGRYVYPGDYKRLMRGGTIVMSNTAAEIDDHSKFINIAKRMGGHVLINGLGLGVCLKAILESDKVEKITVIEKSQDVINLVGNSFLPDKRVVIHHCDALEYKPPKNERYAAVWHDIWDYITPENLPDMHKLHRKYGRRCEWQGSWARWLCECNR